MKKHTRALRKLNRFYTYRWFLTLPFALENYVSKLTRAATFGLLRFMRVARDPLTGSQGLRSRAGTSARAAEKAAGTN